MCVKADLCNLQRSDQPIFQRFQLHPRIQQKFYDQEILNTDIKIINSYPDFDDNNFAQHAHKTDCMNGRVLCNNGIYSYPFLAGDYRGRVGSTFKNFSDSVCAETDFCATCSKNNDYIFTIS